MQNRKEGIFIGLIGLPGVGKSTLAKSLAQQIGARVFIEPGEDEWDIDHSKDWKGQVGRIESWVCSSNATKFREARALAKQGHKTVADAGIFLVNKELIHEPSMQWWYGLISKQEKFQLYTIAERNWFDESCRPDVLVLVETDKAAWLSYMEMRGRSDDNDPECVRQYDKQKKVMADSAERYAQENCIPFVRYINNLGIADKNATELARILDIHIHPHIQQAVENENGVKYIPSYRP